MIVVAAGLLGLVVGSFLYVVVHGVPLRKFPNRPLRRGCRGEYARREMVTVQEERHHGLVYFDGEWVC